MHIPFSPDTCRRPGHPGRWVRESGREELLNADGKFRSVLHPLPHQERAIRAVGEDAFCSATLHGASVPVETHQGERSAQPPCLVPTYCHFEAVFLLISDFILFFCGGSLGPTASRHQGKPQVGRGQSPKLGSGHQSSVSHTQGLTGGLQERTQSFRSVSV